MAGLEALLGIIPVLPRRRLFRASSAPRHWPGILAAGLLATGGALAVAVSLPTDLFGSAPSEGSVSAAPAEVQVVDGETLRLGERVIRLRGLEAPARGERCADAAGRAFDCGAASADRLSRLVADRPLSCRLHGRDSFRRAVGTCEAGGAELSAALVSGGWALASSGTLSAAEDAARTSRLGLWSGGAVAPKGWRDRR